MKTRREKSAGGIIYRWRDGGPEVCLISTHDGDVWQLPKGLIEPGELKEDAAVREVAEETGLKGVQLQPLDKIEYWYVWDYGNGKERVHKRVHFFLFRYVSGSTDDHDDEVDEARWFTVAEARQRLSFANERRIFELAAETIAARANEDQGEAV